MSELVIWVEHLVVHEYEKFELLLEGLDELILFIRVYVGEDAFSEEECG